MIQKMPVLKKYLKNYLAAFFILSFTCASHGQAPAIRLQKSYGSSGSDLACGVRSTPDGGYIVLARSDYNGGDITCSHGGADIWLLKLDSAFEIQWQKCFGGTCNDYASGWLESNDGGSIIIGSTCSNDGDVSGNHSSFLDIWILKLDTAFNIQWQKCLGGSDTESGGCIKATSDGGYIISANTTSHNDGDVGPNHGMEDVWIVKTDSLANIQWQQCYGGGNYDYGNFILPESNGGYVFLSESHSIDGDVIGNHAVNYSPDFWLVKTDSVGTILFRVCLGGSGQELPRSLLKTDDGGYIISGTESSDDGNVSGHHAGTSTGDIWVVKTDSSLNLQWQKCLGGSLGDGAYGMVKSSDGNYFILGVTSSNDYDVTEFSGVVMDYWILKIDTAANIIWQKCIGGSDQEIPFCITETNDSSLVIGGMTMSTDMDVYTNLNQGYYDLWMVKLVPHSNTISGKVFLDTITNGIYDITEPVINNIMISETSTAQFVFTGNAGKYELPVFSPGSFAVQGPAVSYYPMSPSSHTVNFSGMDMKDSLNDFAGVPIQGVNDLSITINPYYGFIYGGFGAYYISYKNIGTTNLSATIKLFPDTALTFVNSSITPASVNSDSVVWTNINLVPCQSGNIIVYVNVGLVASVTSSCMIEPVINDQDSSNNFASWREFTVSSYDPNDKVVSDTSLTLAQALTQPYLDYVIRFQNTGTAPALNIKIRDNISKKLDMNTFELVSASHPVQLEYQQVSRLVTFRFNNIMLPDSNSNEPSSHGYIRYRIRTVPDLHVNNKINNRAWIYFDFNNPVLTNWATTTITLPTGINVTSGEKDELNVFPNPVRDKLFIEIPASPGKNCKLTVFDLAGRIVSLKDVFISNNLISVDLHNLVSGMYFLELKTASRKYNLQVTKE